jgi:hypothetical protein
MDQSTSQSTPSTPANLEQRLRAVQEQIQSYYSNCAMLATTPLDISLYFGRLIPVTRETGEQGLAEYYEKQIVVTIEQARKIANALLQTVQSIDASQQQAVSLAQPSIPSGAVPRPVQSGTGNRLSAALITDEADLEFEIPLGDMQDEKPRQVPASPRQSRPQMAAQAVASPRSPHQVDV